MVCLGSGHGLFWSSTPCPLKMHYNRFRGQFSGHGLSHKTIPCPEIQHALPNLLLSPRSGKGSWKGLGGRPGSPVRPCFCRHGLSGSGHCLFCGQGIREFRAWSAWVPEMVCLGSGHGLFWSSTPCPLKMHYNRFRGQFSGHGLSHKTIPCPEIQHALPNNTKDLARLVTQSKDQGRGHGGEPGKPDNRKFSLLISNELGLSLCPE